MASDIEFEWDNQNRAHGKAHRVSSEEFEQVILNDPLDIEHQTEAGEERFRSLGVTNEGRTLIIIWTIRAGKIRAITAYPPGKAIEKIYWEMKG